jgi:hypothetical protein
MAAVKPKVVHSTTLQDRCAYHLSMLCAVLGCDAIEARAMWSAGDSTIVVQAEAGAADGDVMRLKRWPRPKAVR